MVSELVTYKGKCKNYSKREKAEEDYKYIVILASGINADIEQCEKIYNRDNSYISTHYFIDSDGNIGNYIDEKYTSWSCGNRVLNDSCISIMVNSYIDPKDNSDGYDITDKCKVSLLKLIADIRIRCKIYNDIALFSTLMIPKNPSSINDISIDDPMLSRYKPLLDKIPENIVSATTYMKPYKTM